MNRPRLGTRTVHPPAGPTPGRGLVPAIEPASVFAATSLDDAVRLEEMADGVSSYTRVANPTVQALERAVADLEDGESALAFPSGMAALTTTFLTVLRHGDTVVVHDGCYSDTAAALRALRGPMRLRLALADLCSDAGIEAVRSSRPALVVAESITNPMVRVPALRALADATHAAGGLLVVDNTIASPVNLRPLDWGADVVVHSASKYLGGHFNAIAGVVVAGTAWTDRVAETRTTFGTCLDPRAAWQVLVGLQTLALRIERQNATALRLATFLTGHDAVAATWYPLLPGHPDAKAVAEQLDGGGGVVTFCPRTDTSGLARLLESFRIARIAVSLGGTKTLVEAPALMSHVHTDPDVDRADGGTFEIPANAVRLSVGIEDPDDLFADLDQALATLGR